MGNSDHAPPASGPQSPASAGLSIYTFPILVGVLVFAPLIKGGNRPIPLLMLQLAAIVLLVLFAVDWDRARTSLSPALRVILAILLIWPLVQLIPLGDAWRQIAGRDLYAAPLAATGLAPSHASASVAPRATEAAWLTLLVSIAVFLGTLATPREKVKILIYVFVAIAASQAIIGLAQYGTSSYSVIFPGGEPVRNAHGTYANYDHLAGLLEMALPVALALLAASVHRKDSSPGRSKQKQTTSSRRLLQLGSNQVALFAAATVAILLGLIFSRSRTGISLTMFVVLISALAFARQIGGKSSARFVTAIVVVGIALAVEIGLAPVLARFTEQAVSSDSRWSIFAGTWFGIRHFMPIGSGLGTYPLAFRYFQGEDVPRFVNHAHNDYLEWLMDGGAALAIALLAAFGVYATRCLRFVLAAQWTSDTFYRTGAAIGVLAIGLHGLVDFNFHIPANAVFAALLLAVTMHTEPGRSTANTEIGMRTREDRHRTKQEGPTSGAVSKTPNPFAE